MFAKLFKLLGKILKAYRKGMSPAAPKQQRRRSYRQPTGGGGSAAGRSSTSPRGPGRSEGQDRQGAPKCSVCWRRKAIFCTGSEEDGPCGMCVACCPGHKQTKQQPNGRPGLRVVGGGRRDDEDGGEQGGEDGGKFQSSVQGA